MTMLFTDLSQEGLRAVPGDDDSIYVVSAHAK